MKNKHLIIKFLIRLGYFDNNIVFYDFENYIYVKHLPSLPIIGINYSELTISQLGIITVYDSDFNKIANFLNILNLQTKK